MMSDRGWCNYGRAPSHRYQDRILAREAGDPPMVVWRIDATSWVVDDDVEDRLVSLGGFTREEVEASLAFAQAMGWVTPGSTVVFRDAPPPDR
jgi:hypothetical protein